MLEKSVFQWYNSRKFPDLWENWNFARRKRRRVLMMGKLQMDREWTEQDLRTFAEGAQAAFETVLLDELPQDTGWQDEGLQVSYSLCNGRASCVLHRTVRADGKLWRITMSAPLAGNLLPEERMSARERELCREDLNHDFLSGVYNRRYLETVIAAELDRWAEQGRKAAVALVSLDHGAQLRDTYGQPVMDQLICFVANQWKKYFDIPGSQIVCRLTGTTEVALLAEIAELSEEEKAHAPFFLPYLSGERTPHNDPDARGIFWGMTHASLRAQLGYAVLEGVSFGINDGLQALKESGTPIAQCSLVGGGARSPFWAQLLADILAMPVVTHKGGETGGALGAARLACLAAGKPIAAVCEKPEVWQTWRADPIRHHTLMQRYAQFKALYLNDLKYRQH